MKHPVVTATVVLLALGSLAGCEPPREQSPIAPVPKRDLSQASSAKSGAGAASTKKESGAVPASSTK